MSSSSSDGISISSISTTPAATGCHMLKIDGYSQTKLFATDYRATSPVFEAAGQNWYISYYPNGTWPQAAPANDIALFINPRSPITRTARANIRFSLVPHVGKPAPPPYCKSFALAFSPERSPASDCCGFSRFIKREELEKSGYLVDDCFAIRCDVEVVKMSAAADPAVSAHDLERLSLPCTCNDGQCKRLHLPRAVEPASPDRHSDDGGDVAGSDKSPAAGAADRDCARKDDLCKDRAVEPASPDRHSDDGGDVAGWDKSPAAGAADRGCACKDDLCKESAVEAPPPPQGHGIVVPALPQRRQI